MLLLLLDTAAWPSAWYVLQKMQSVIAFPKAAITVTFREGSVASCPQLRHLIPFAAALACSSVKGTAAAVGTANRDQHAANFHVHF